MEREQVADRPRPVTVGEAQQGLLEFVAVLQRWSRRLEGIADGLPVPRYHPQTDEPLNDAAHIQGLVRAMLFDDLPTLERVLQLAARGLGDPV